MICKYGKTTMTLSKEDVQEAIKLFLEKDDFNNLEYTVENLYLYSKGASFTVIDSNRIK